MAKRKRKSVTQQIMHEAIKILNKHQHDLTRQQYIRDFLTLIVILTSIPMTFIKTLSVTAETTSYKVGDIIEFGIYPQSEVLDASLITTLNSLAPSWDYWSSYGYYSGDGNIGCELKV